MNRPWSHRTRRLLLGASLAAFAALGAGRLAEYDPIPWEWVVAFCVGTFLLVGPLAWGLRARLPDERRERLGYVAAVAVLFCVPFVITLGILSGTLLTIVDAGAVGGIVGFAIAVLAERTVVPERLRGATV